MLGSMGWLCQFSRKIFGIRDLALLLCSVTGLNVLNFYLSVFYGLTLFVKFLGYLLVGTYVWAI